MFDMFKLLFIMLIVIWTVELGSWLANTCGGTYGVVMGATFIILCFGSTYFFYRRI